MSGMVTTKYFYFASTIPLNTVVFVYQWQILLSNYQANAKLLKGLVSLDPPLIFCCAPQLCSSID